MKLKKEETKIGGVGGKVHMSEINNGPSLNNLMQAVTQALYNCQESMSKNNKQIEGLDANQAEHLLKLMESLVDTKIQLTQEIKLKNVSYIDPVAFNEMELAINMAISKPLDSKVNQIYFSIFGYNSALWHVLNEIKKLMQTAAILKKYTKLRITKTEKINRVGRKKRHEEDSMIDEDGKEKNKK